MSMLNDECSLINVLDKLHDAGFSAADWKELGRRVKPLVPEPDLKRFEANNSNKAEGCLEKVIDHWQRNGEDPSWETLAQAVAQCREGGGQNVAANLLRTVGRDPQHLMGSWRTGPEITESLPPTSLASLEVQEGAPRHKIQKQESVDSAVESEDKTSLFSPLSPQSSLPLSSISSVGDSLPDAKTMFEEIKDAKDRSFALAMKLNLSIETRKEIVAKKLKPEDRLIQTLEEYKKIVEPKPSWKGIADALKSDLVKLHSLGEKIEVAHCSGSRVVEDHERLKKSFASLVNATRHATELQVNDAARVVDRIMDLPVVGKARDKEYLMEYADQLRESRSVPAVFDRLRCHWDYLHPEIYGSLVKEMSLTQVKPHPEDYQKELDNFLDQTALSDFCAIPGIEDEKDSDPPPKFTRFISKHLWQPPPKYLRDVENYRRELANKCSLQSCAVTIASIKPGCVIVSMLVPVETDLKVASDLDFIREYSIVQMTFNGVVIYSQDTSEKGSSVDPILRVRKSRAKVALRFLFKKVFDKPVRRLLKNQKSHLTVAVENGYLDRVRELIASGEDPNPHTISTPLKEACSRGDIEIARALLGAGADPNLVTDEWTPLMEASRVGNREMVELLMEFGADPNTVNGEDWTALMAASNNGRTEAVASLLQRGADPNKQDHVGWSAILSAVNKDHEDIVKNLVEAGVNPHMQNLECLSAMRLALKNNQEKMVTVFLDRHPDLKRGLRGDPELDWPDKYGETDLLYACKNCSLEVVKQILRKGADPNLANINGESPLLTAIGYGESEMVEELLKSGADPNMATVGEPPLSAAVGTGNSKIVADLLHFGADPNFLTDKGTPLALAVRCGDFKMVEDLLVSGAKPNMASFVDQLPLHHANRLENADIKKLLEDYKADSKLEEELPKRISAGGLAMGAAMGAASLIRKRLSFQFTA